MRVEMFSFNSETASDQSTTSRQRGVTQNHCHVAGAYRASHAHPMEVPHSQAMHIQRKSAGFFQAEQSKFLEQPPVVAETHLVVF